MTTISVSGKIIALEVEDDFGIVSLTGGPTGSRTTISPSGKTATVVAASPGNPGVSNDMCFALNGSFDVGDVVEIFPVTDAITAILPNVVDENGVNCGAGKRFRKIATGAPTFTFPGGSPIAIST